jgi:hypothetical protein
MLSRFQKFAVCVAKMTKRRHPSTKGELKRNAGTQQARENQDAHRLGSL